MGGHGYKRGIRRGGGIWAEVHMRAATGDGGSRQGRAHRRVVAEERPGEGDELTLAR